MQLQTTNITNQKSVLDNATLLLQTRLLEDLLTSKKIINKEDFKDLLISLSVQ